MRGRAVAMLSIAALIAVGVGVLVTQWVSSPDAVGHSSHPKATASPTTGPVAAGQFADGACERLVPTHGNRHQVVYLDAGHGGLDPGALGVTQAGQHINEASITLPVTLDVANQLRAQGFTVVVSRTGNTSVAKLGPQDTSGGVLTLQGVHNDVAARAVCANDAHADLLIGIYFNAGGSPSNAGSITAYDTARPFAAANQKLAELVQANVLASMNAHGWQIPNDGAVVDSELGSHGHVDPNSPLAKESSNYPHLLMLGPAKAGYFSTPSEMPGVIVEPLYLTDPFEATIATSAVGQHAIATGIATAVERDLAPPATPKPTSSSSGH